MSLRDLHARLTDRVEWRRWRAIVCWYGSIAGTALAFLPWWVHGPSTLALAVLVSRAARSSFARANAHYDEHFAASSKMARELHDSHLERLDDLEHVAVFGAGRKIVSVDQARLEVARSRVRNRAAA